MGKILVTVLAVIGAITLIALAILSLIMVESLLVEEDEPIG